MQDANGGWKYWENDTTVNNNITPYVVRSLYEFRKLGIAIPDDVISRGLEYMSTIEAMDDMDNRAEIFATLAQGKHQETKTIQQSIYYHFYAAAFLSLSRCTLPETTTPTSNRE